MRAMTLQELYNVGLHYGHKKEHSTPMTRPYVYMVRDGICIIDLAQTLHHLHMARDFLRQAASEGKTILMVGTKRQARPLVSALAKTLGLPYVTNRWFGGMLTNFVTIHRSLDHLAELEQQTASLEFGARPKREQKRVKDEIDKLHRSFDGIKDMSKLPDVLFVIDAHGEENALIEAAKMGVTTVATIDTNGDPRQVDYPIPCNDDSPRGLRYVLGRVGEAVSEGLGQTFTLPEELEVDTTNLPAIKKSDASDAT